MMSLEEFAQHYWFYGIFLLILLFAAYVGLFSTVEAREDDFPNGYFFYKNY